MRALAQIFKNSGNKPTKCSLYLKPVEVSPSEAFDITSDTVIDATNFSKITLDGNGGYFFTDTVSGSTGAGCLNSYVLPMRIITSNTYVSYPVHGKDGKYTLWIRVRNLTLSSGSIKLRIDGYSPTSITIPTDVSWYWVSTTFVLPDNKVHNLNICPVDPSLQIDKLYITQTGTVPTLTGPDYTTSTYITCHVRLSYINEHMLPISSALMYDAKSTLLHIVKPDWYNFDLDTLSTTISQNNHYAITLNTAGASQNRTVIWDTAEQDLPSAYNDGSWASDTATLMLKVFSDYSPLTGNVLVSPNASLVQNTVNEFDVSSLAPTFANTEVVADLENGNDVELSTGEKLASIIVDQTGSSTWNDPNGLRVDVATDVVQAIEDRYPTPSDVRYNLFNVTSPKTFSVLVPLTRQIESNSISDIVKEAFRGSSSNFAGFRVLRKEGSEPTTPIDGEIVFDGYSLGALDTDLVSSLEYYYKVFTYDHSYHFSEGVSIKAIPNIPDIPRGVPSFKGSILKGYGPIIDENTVALWHMDEGSGDFVFDFSLNALTLDLLHTRWLDQLDSPIGLFGLRLNGGSSRVTSRHTSLLNFTEHDSFTIIATIYPLSVTGTQTILSRTDTGIRNYVLGLNGNKLTFTFDGTNIATSNISVVQSMWQSIAVVYNGSTVTFYVDGIADTPVSLTTSSINTSPMQINIGWNSFDGTPYTFFGKISHVSIHDTIRDANYIEAATNQPKDDRGNAIENGDRVVVLKWHIPDDPNYTNIRVLMNRMHAPRHEDDGTIVYESSALPRLYTKQISGEYDLLHTYYFSIFTQNGFGNWSDIEDSKAIEIKIPDRPRTDISIDTDTGGTITQAAGPGYGSFSSPTVTIGRAGNEKVWLKWTVPADPEISRVVVYYSSEAFPKYDPKTKEITGGTIVWDGIKSIDSFVHRGLTNRRTAFYTIVTKDKYLRFSSLVTTDESGSPLRFVPLSEINDAGIPLLEAQNVSYHILDADKVALTWDSPVTFNKQVSGWFDDKFYIYGAVCDIYGNPLYIEFPENFKITSNIDGYSASQVEDAFNIGADATNISRVPAVSFHINKSGLINGTITLNNNGVLSILENLTIGLTATYKYSDKFTYKLPNASVTFNNPVGLELTNRDNNYLSVREFGADCEVGPESGPPGDEKRKRVNATYIRRSTPLVIRSNIKFKNQPVRRSSIRVRIYNDKKKNNTTVDPCSLEPSLNLVSTTVKLSSRAFAVQQVTSPIFDSAGQPTAYSETVSFSDLSVVPPKLPQSAAVFVMVTYNGFSMIRKMNVFFANILKMALSASAPHPDGIEVTEQFARVWLIDPDNPSDESKYTIPPNNTIVKWTLAKDTQRVKNVPFYSTDNVPLGNGIYSYTYSGTAGKIFFGPATSAAAGKYAITASTNVSGLSASVTSNVEIQGITGTIFSLPLPNVDDPRILAEFDEPVKTVWADGVDYIKMNIWRNPSTSSAVFKSYFLSCSPAIALLTAGSIVTVDAKDWDIIHGSVIETTDPDTNITTIDITNAIVDHDLADVTLTRNPSTSVYLRTNRLIKDNACKDTSPNDCGIPMVEKYCGEATTVLVSSKINYNGLPKLIYGGGAMKEGLPPTIAVAKEPLKFEYVGSFIGTQPTNEIVIDGQTENIFIARIGWDDEQIPENVPVNITVQTTENEAGHKITDYITIPATIYSTNTTDPTLNPTGEPLSIARLVLPPFPTNMSFSMILTFTVDYNLVGTVSRKKQFAVKFSYMIQKPLVAAPPSPAITTRFQRYDTVGNTWVSLTDMNAARAAFNMHTSGNDIIAISGTDGSQLLSSVEKYDIAQNTWILQTPITTPRIYAQSVEFNGDIYVIGGLTATPAGDLFITPKVSKYNITSDTWSNLEDMPTDYAVAFGSCHYYNGKIYVLSGYRKEIYTYNDSVLAYDINTDTWSIVETFTDENLALFSRIGAFSFLKNNAVHVLNGLYYLPPQRAGDEYTPEVKIHLATAYEYTIGGTIANSESLYVDMPVPKFLGGTATIGNNEYFIGGINDTSNTLRYFENVDTTSSPFSYNQLTKISNGRSSFGMSVKNSYIYISGGVTNRRDSNFLKVTTTATPSTVYLNGRQTGGIDITVTDENGDSPSQIDVKLTGNVSDYLMPVLFSSDIINVKNGIGTAVLLPRSEDDGELVLGEGASPRTYVASVSGSIIDSDYYGDTDTTVTTPIGGSTTDPNIALPSLTTDVSPLYEFETVIRQDYANSGAVIQFSNIGGFLELVPTETYGGSPAVVTYQSSYNWLPQIESIIDNNNGTYDDVVAYLDRMKPEIPFGGSPLIDAVVKAAGTMSIDDTDAEKSVLFLTDGMENLSAYSEDDAVSALDAVSGHGKTSLVGGIVKVIPTGLSLDSGARLITGEISSIASQTDGSITYITNDKDVESTVKHIISAKGFIGDGSYGCLIDLGTNTLIESIRAEFDLTDPDASAKWYYSIAKDDEKYSETSDPQPPDETIGFVNTICRYIKFDCILSASIGINEYGLGSLVPPRLTKIIVSYHKKTTSDIYLNGIESGDTSQVLVTLDVNNPVGSEIKVGVSSFRGTSFEDYHSPAQPYVNNDSRIIIPLRKTLDERTLATLEPLHKINDFVFEASYGKWPFDSEIAVYDDTNTLIDPDTYKAFPDRGYIVFTGKTDGNYILSVTNKPQLNVAVQITNSVHDNPVMIYGAGYYYTTTEPIEVESGRSKTVPEALNVMVVPVEPNVSSTFVGLYTYYDLSGYDEYNSKIHWYINGVHQEDLDNLERWDNIYWNLAKAGDQVYFSVTPSNRYYTGKEVTSLPVIVKS